MDQATNKAMECYKICQQTITHCLEMGGAHASPAHIGALMDCAKACHMSADFMIRGSALHPKVCAVCAAACNACAESCDQVGPDDEMMQACAQACRDCAALCDQMAG